MIVNNRWRTNFLPNVLRLLYYSTYFLLLSQCFQPTFYCWKLAKGKKLSLRQISNVRLKHFIFWIRSVNRFSFSQYQTAIFLHRPLALAHGKKTKSLTSCRRYSFHNHALTLPWFIRCKRRQFLYGNRVGISVDFVTLLFLLRSSGTT